jgi:hypothetical protein
MTEYKKLYWCYTLELYKRYFIIANSARKARKQFASENRYYQKDVSVERICRLPDKHQTTIQIHPSDSLLTECKVEFIYKLHKGDKLSTVIRLMLKPGGRVFNFQNRIYQEDL